LPSEPQRAGAVDDAVALTTSPQAAPVFPRAATGAVGAARPATPAAAAPGRSHSAAGDAGIHGSRKLSAGHGTAVEPAGAQPSPPAQPVASAPPSEPAPVTAATAPSAAPVAAVTAPAGANSAKLQGKESGKKAGGPSTAKEDGLDDSEDVAGGKPHGG